MEYRPELRVRFQVSEQYDVLEIDSIPVQHLGIREALDEMVQRCEGNKAPFPILFFILQITCSNVPNMNNIVPSAVEDDGRLPSDLEPAEVQRHPSPKQRTGGDMKDSTL
jgi:hypothetical protein